MNVLNRLMRPALLLLVIVFAGLASAQNVIQESQASIMRRLVNEVYAGERSNLLATAFSPDFAWVGPGPQETRLADWRVEVEALSAALPDLEGRTIELVSGSDWVAHLVRMRGTFDAPLEWRGQTLAPNGETVEWLQFDMVHFLDDGRAGYGFSERDTLALEAQFGAAEPEPQRLQPAQAASAASAGQAAQPAQAGAALTVYTREDEDRFLRTLDDFLEASIDTPDMTVFAPLFSDSFQLHLSTGDGALEDLTALLVAVKTALPDAGADTSAPFVDDGYAPVRLGLRGTFLGQWTGTDGADVPPNSQPVYLTANLLFHFDADARIDELWLIYDRENWDAQFAAPLPEGP